MERPCAQATENVPPANAAAGVLLLRQRLTVHLTDTPNGAMAVAPPVSCPSRLQLSPTSRGSAAFDPFAPPAVDEPPGCTPLCAQQADAPPAPPAVHRKPAVEGSPVPLAPPAMPFPADRVQSCPPERAGRRGARPLVRIRVKRSLNGAVAAAAGSGAGAAASRRSLDMGVVGQAGQPGLQQLAGCSRKRFEADLLSPPLPRKSSRTLLEDQHAADMIAALRLTGLDAGQPQLATLPLGGGASGAVPAAPNGMQWAPGGGAGA